MHAPWGNVLAAAEHTMALLLALARYIPTASGSLKAGTWEKSRFVEVELSHKTLGILGMGKVGREVARRALAFSKPVLAFDPLVSVEQAKRARVTLLNKAEVLRQADFVTLHVALPSHASGAAKLISARTGAAQAWCLPGELRAWRLDR